MDICHRYVYTSVVLKPFTTQYRVLPTLRNQRLSKTLWKKVKKKVLSLSRISKLLYPFNVKFHRLNYIEVVVSKLFVNLIKSNRVQTLNLFIFFYFESVLTKFQSLKGNSTQTKSPLANYTVRAHPVTLTLKRKHLYEWIKFKPSCKTPITRGTYLSLFSMKLFQIYS